MEKQLSASWEAKLTGWFSCFGPQDGKKEVFFDDFSKAQFWSVEIKESGLIGVWQEQNAERKTTTMN